MNTRNVTIEDAFGQEFGELDENGFATSREVLCVACGRDVHQIDFQDGRAVCMSEPKDGWCPEGYLRWERDGGVEIIRAVWNHGKDTSRIVRELGRWRYERACGLPLHAGDVPASIQEAARRVAVATLYHRKASPPRSPETVWWNEDSSRWESVHPTDPIGGRVGIAADADIVS